MAIPNREDCFALFPVLLHSSLKFAGSPKKRVLCAFTNYFAFFSHN